MESSGLLCGGSSNGGDYKVQVLAIGLGVDTPKWATASGSVPVHTVPIFGSTDVATSSGPAPVSVSSPGLDSDPVLAPAFWSVDAPTLILSLGRWMPPTVLILLFPSPGWLVLLPVLILLLFLSLGLRVPPPVQILLRFLSPGLPTLRRLLNLFLFLYPGR
ncbi:hypothetical protein Q8A73_006414 [Channa argus]|nr:hypothetical protein Q8A73_006414 [Channa argus]